MLPRVIVSHYIPLHIILYIHLISHYIPLYQIISHYLLQQYPITSHSGQIQSYPHVSWWLQVSPPLKQRTRLFPKKGVTTDLPHIFVASENGGDRAQHGNWLRGSKPSNVGKLNHSREFRDGVFRQTHTGWWFGTFFIFPYIENN